MEELTLGSLCDGIGGWLLAGRDHGIKALWSSEIDPFPASISHKHFPEAIQLGDMTKIDGSKIPPVDIITGGTPCQSFSVAGKREGMDGASGVFGEFPRIVGEMLEATNRKYPKFCILENVPGMLSSTGGEDIKAVLNVFDELGFVLDINILDAQYMGVAQRRKRVFAVWENIDYILPMRTDTSFSIITQALAEILLCICNAHLNLCATERKNSIWHQRKLSEDGLQKKMKLFRIEEEQSFKTLLNNWVETLATYLKEQQKLVAHLLQTGELQQEDTRKFASTLKMANEWFGNIDMLWNKLLADLFSKGKSFTTLTETSEITDQTICVCAHLLESISLLTTPLTRLWKNLYETELYTSTARSVFTKYANEKSSDVTLFSEPISIYSWDAYLDLVSHEREFTVGDFGDQCRPEVLFEPEGLLGDTTESTEQGQGIAEGTEGSVGSTGTPYTLQVRCGKPGGGKGALIQTNKSATLSTHNMQTLFQSDSLTPWDAQGNRVAGNIAPSLRGGGKGGNGYPNGNVMQAIGTDLYNGNLTGDVTCTITNESCASAGHSGPSVMQAKAVNERRDGDVYLQDKAWSVTTGGGKPGQGYAACIQPQGVDLYNQEITGNTACTVTSAVGGTNTSGPKVMESYAFEPGITARLGRPITKECCTTLRANMGDNQTAVLTTESSTGGAEQGILRGEWTVTSSRPASNSRDAELYARPTVRSCEVKTALGNKVIGTLAAADGPKSVTGQSLSEGKLIMEKVYDT